MGRKRIDITGQKFGRLTAIKLDSADPGQVSRWLFKCECGNERVIRIDSVTTGNAQSCGCYKKECAIANGQKTPKKTHGLYKSREYRAWVALINRCENPRNADYSKYGGRGISVCARWRHNFTDFYTDMGQRPSANHSIDRIDVNGNYEPSNCRWATKSEQQKNKRPKKI